MWDEDENEVADERGELGAVWEVEVHTRALVKTYKVLAKNDLDARAKAFDLFKDYVKEQLTGNPPLGQGEPREVTQYVPGDLVPLYCVIDLTVAVDG